LGETFEPFFSRCARLDRGVYRLRANKGRVVRGSGGSTHGAW